MLPPRAREVEAVRGDQSDVQFDFERALRLARRLWALADHVDHIMRSRQDLTIAVRKDFTGTYADQFAQRVEEELTGALASLKPYGGMLRSVQGVGSRPWTRRIGTSMGAT